MTYDAYLNLCVATHKFRCFLLKLGFIGDDFKAARKILLAGLPGSGSHKTGDGKKVASNDAISPDKGGESLIHVCEDDSSVDSAVTGDEAAVNG